MVAADKSTYRVPMNAAGEPISESAPLYVAFGSGAEVGLSAGTTVAISGTATVQGDVGSAEGQITYTPTITAGAYTAGDAVGALVELSSVVETAGKGIIITGVTLVDADQQDAAIDLVFFNAAPTGITDNAAFAPSSTDLFKVARVIKLAAADYTDFSANSACDPGNVGVGIKTLASTSLWLQLMTEGTPTYTTTSSLKLVIDYVRN